MSKCPNSLFDKHNYQGRYDEEMPPGFEIKGNILPREMIDMINAYKTRTYVCDVCQHCGDKIVR